MDVVATLRAAEADVLWAKLSRLCPLACATTAFDATLGEILADPTAGAPR